MTTIATIKSAALPKVEFTRAKIEPVRNVVMSVDGLPKSGKTEFMLSMPAPLCIHNLNFGLKGVIDKHILAEKEIYVFDYDMPYSNRLPGAPSNSMLDLAGKVWDKFARQFMESLSCMRSVGVDMGTEAWDLIRLARLGKLTQVMPVQYTSVNAEFRQLIQESLRSTANVAYLHKLKAVYKDDKKTGEYERAGFNDIGFDVEAVIRTSRDYSKKGMDQFSGTLEECRANFGASGTVFTGGNFTFNSVEKTIYPDLEVA